MSDNALFSGADVVNETLATLEARLKVVRERYDAYHPDMASRRYVADEYHDAARCIRGAKGWLAGDNDRSYAGPHPSFGTTLEDFRVHYANDSARTALHHLVWAEHYAGLRDRESARSLDPWNNR